MAKPKLALIPAAQGSKLFSVLPSSGVGDFDFTRDTIATRINSQGLIEEVANGVSRLNYPMIDGKVVGCPHHILEPVRTNLITYSEDFSNSYWTKIGSSVVSGFTSPRGDLSAFKFVEDTSTTHGMYNPSNSFSSVSNGSYSIFVKYNGRQWVRLFCQFGTTSFNSWFDILNGVAGNSSADESDIEDYGNGWFKITQTNSLDAINGRYRLYLADADNSTSYIGDGTSGAYIWGAQAEEGSYATSYIPTNGEANGVTRSAETANGSGDAATFNDSEGVFMAEISALSYDSSLRTITLGDNSSSNAVSFRYDKPNQNQQITLYLNSGGASQFSAAANVQTLQFNKCLIKYKANDFSAWVNGFEVGTGTSGITFPSGTLNRINFDIGYTSTDPFYGKTKQIQYYNTALTDSELEQLTSWTSFTDMAEGQLYSVE